MEPSLHSDGPVDSRSLPTDDAMGSGGDSDDPMAEDAASDDESAIILQELPSSGLFDLGCQAVPKRRNVGRPKKQPLVQEAKPQEEEAAKPEKCKLLGDASLVLASLSAKLPNNKALLEEASKPLQIVQNSRLPFSRGLVPPSPLMTMLAATYSCSTLDPSLIQCRGDQISQNLEFILDLVQE